MRYYWLKGRLYNLNGDYWYIVIESRDTEFLSGIVNCISAASMFKLMNLKFLPEEYLEILAGGHDRKSPSVPVISVYMDQLDISGPAQSLENFAKFIKEAHLGA